MSIQTRVRSFKSTPILRTSSRTGAIFAAIFSVAIIGKTLGAERSSVRMVVEQYCVSCHDAEAVKGGLNFDAVLTQEIGRDQRTWEKVARRLRGRQMPPSGEDRPSEQT